MSVINKMLRDLDARRADASLPDLPRQARVAAMQGTASVMGEPQRARTRGWLVALLLLVGTGVLLWAYLDTVTPESTTPATVSSAVPQQSNPPVQAQADATQVTAPQIARGEPVPVPTGVPASKASAAPAPVAASSQPTPVPPRPVPAQAVTSVARAPAAIVSSGASVPSRRAEIAPAPPPPPMPAEKVKEIVTPRPSLASVPERVPAAQPHVPARAGEPVAAEPAKTAAGVASSAPVAPRRLMAAKEALAQSQALWQSGSREAALELLREARVLVERGQPADTTALVMLVREQVQMEIAQGRPGVVHDLLKRLEPQLSEQADLWAVRGNAAQRLGLHQDSVQAYEHALKLRPGESRWLLGAAVSRAALGQVEAAAKQAELARAAGPVSPEVLNYLRQAGVPLR